MPEPAVKSHPVEERSKGAGLGGVMSFAAMVTSAYQARVLKNSQMFRYRGLRDLRVVREHPYSLFTVAAETLEKRAASRIGERLE